MNEIREKGIEKLNDLKLNMEKTWSEGLKNVKSILQLKDIFKDVLDILETAEEDLRLVFSTLVNTCKIIVDPAIKIIAQMIQDKPMDEQNEQKVSIPSGLQSENSAMYTMGPEPNCLPQRQKSTFSEFFSNGVALEEAFKNFDFSP